MPAAASALPPFVPAHNYGTPQPTSMPFPRSIMAPPLYSSGSPSPTVLPHGTNHPSRAYTPDAWIYTLGNQNTTMNRSGAKPPLVGEMGSVIVFVYTMADHTDVIDEFLEDLDNLTDNVDDSSTESANSERSDERSARKRRLIPFYQTRKDVLSYFSAEKLMRTFRFDRPSIEYLTALVTDILPKRKTAAKR
ncbi:Uncharacterized protein APZ42_006240, partial [Daphnia magna]